MSIEVPVDLYMWVCGTAPIDELGGTYSGTLTCPCEEFGCTDLMSDALGGLMDPACVLGRRCRCGLCDCSVGRIGGSAE